MAGWGTTGRAARVAVAAAAGSMSVLLLAPAAVAATGIDITRASDGSAVSTSTPVSSDDVLHVVGHVPAFTGSTQLVVRQPGDPQSHPVGSASTTTSAADIRWDLRTACVSFGSGSCTQALNGQWTVSLTGGYTASRSFTLRIPPAVVQGVAASANQTVVTVNWQPNSEPDLRGYDVLTADDHPVVTGIDPAKACGSGGCSVTFDMGSGSGGDHAFVVRALRSTCPGCDATVASADSQPSSVTIHEPTPSPSAGGTAGSGGTGSAGSTGAGSGTSAGSGGARSGGTTTGTTTGGRSGTAASARSFDSTFRSYVPGAVVVGAPDLPAVKTEVAPLPDGSYKPTLAYPDQVEKQVVREPANKPIAATFTDNVARIADNHLLWRSVAAACLLLLVAGHLRAWVSGADHHDG